MTLSEKMALDMIADLDFGEDSIRNIFDSIGFILTVARQNDNWDLVDDLLDKGYGYLISK